MKKITKMLTLLLAVVMVFTGCATMENTIVINSDGSARITHVTDIEKEAMDKYITQTLGYKNPEEYMKSQYYGTYFETVTIDGKEYYETREVNYASAKTLAEDVYYSMYVSEKGLYITKDTVYGVVNAMSDEYYNEYLTQLKAAGYTLGSAIKAKLVFEFPADITSTNGTIDKTNAKKVTFNVDVTKDTTIFATTNKANTLNSVKSKVDKLNTVKQPTIKSLKVTNNKKKKCTATLTLKKMKGVRYEVEYSTSKKFKYSKTRYKDTKKTTIKLKKLKKGKTYYVRVRAYKENYASACVYSKYTKKTLKVQK